MDSSRAPPICRAHGRPCATAALAQADAFARALPREFVPAELLAQQGLRDAVAEAALAASGPAAASTVAAASEADPARALGGDGIVDCLEACCLHDDLHLFRQDKKGRSRGCRAWCRAVQKDAAGPLRSA